MHYEFPSNLRCIRHKMHWQNRLESGRQERTDLKWFVSTCLLEHHSFVVLIFSLSLLVAVSVHISRTHISVVWLFGHFHGHVAKQMFSIRPKRNLHKLLIWRCTNFRRLQGTIMLRICLYRSCNMTFTLQDMFERKSVYRRVSGFYKLRTNDVWNAGLLAILACCD